MHPWFFAAYTGERWLSALSCQVLKCEKNFRTVLLSHSSVHCHFHLSECERLWPQWKICLCSSLVGLVLCLIRAECPTFQLCLPQSSGFSATTYSRYFIILEWNHDLTGSYLSHPYSTCHVHLFSFCCFQLLHLLPALPLVWWGHCWVLVLCQKPLLRSRFRNLTYCTRRNQLFYSVGRRDINSIKIINRVSNMSIVYCCYYWYYHCCYY